MGRDARIDHWPGLLTAVASVLQPLVPGICAGVRWSRAGCPRKNGWQMALRRTGMVSVFLSFALAEDRMVKEFGVGLATAILLDATVVRLFLVPSLRALLGRWNWYLPDFLGRLIPNLNVKSSSDPAPPPKTLALIGAVPVRLDANKVLSPLAAHVLLTALKRGRGTARSIADASPSRY